MEIKIVFLNSRNVFNSLDYELIDGREEKNCLKIYKLANRKRIIY